MTSVVNPTTGAVVSADAEITAAPSSSRGDDVWVWLRPSVRAGHARDLASYPADWIVEGAPRS